MTKYVYEYGKRWHVETPRYAIHRMAGKLHVSDTDLLSEMIEKAFEKSKDKNKFTPAIRKECHQYAAICMKKNMELYRKVMGGRL